MRCVLGFVERVPDVGPANCLSRTNSGKRNQELIPNTLYMKSIFCQ